VAVCGRSLLTVDRLRAAGIQQAYALTDIEPDLQRCLAEAGPLLEQRARALARDWLSPRERSDQSDLARAAQVKSEGDP
jgi:glycerate kinase